MQTSIAIDATPSPDGLCTEPESSSDGVLETTTTDDGSPRRSHSARQRRPVPLAPIRRFGEVVAINTMVLGGAQSTGYGVAIEMVCASILTCS